MFFESTPLFKKLSTNTNIVKINSNNGVLPANTFQLSKLFDGWMDGFSEKKKKKCYLSSKLAH